MTIAFPFLISMIPVGIALVILLVGWALGRTVVPGLGFIVAGFGILFGAVFGPSLFLDKVRVDETHIEQATGFWFHQTRKGFPSDDLRRVRIATGRDLKGREIEIWVAEYESRPPVQIDPGDLWEPTGPRSWITFGAWILMSCARDEPPGAFAKHLFCAPSLLSSSPGKGIS